mmetsp:Transcript_23005/g.69098  ORF Transcript_23005/g.69098 Transcript_23005/m.69098 type:complete len:325 (+) Transcript_23005:1179-2153(+)
MYKPVHVSRTPTVRAPCVDVSFMVVVVAAEVRLEAGRAVREEVLRCIVVRGAVVRVDGFLRRVDREHEILANLAELGHHRRSAAREIRDVRNAVPAVERPVVAALAHAVREQIALEHVRAAEAVVEIDPRAGPVKMHVVDDARRVRDCLEHERRLLLPEPDLARDVFGNNRAVWLFTSASVRTDLVVELRFACFVEAGARVAPERDARIPYPREVVVVNGEAAMVAIHVNGVPIETREFAVLDRQPFRALERQRAVALERPVAAGRHAMRIEVRVQGVDEGDASNGHVADGLFRRARDVDQRPRGRGDELLVARRRRGGVGIVE